MTDAYKIGVSIVLANGVSPILGIIAKDMLGLKGVTKEVEKGFGSWSLKLKAVAGLLGSAGILGFMVDLIDKTKEYNTELVKLQRIGPGMAAAVKSGAIQSQAFAIARKVPLKVEDILSIAGASNSVLGGNVGEVRQTLYPLSKFAFMLEHDKNYHGNVQQDVADALRAGELSGRITDKAGNISIKKLNDWLGFVLKVQSATHGTVNAQTLKGMAQQAGFTMRTLSPMGMTMMAIQAQAMGGPRAGTAYLSLWQQMAAGTMFSRTAEALQHMGFLHAGEWHTKGGRVIISDAASKRLTALIDKNPEVFVDAIKAALEKTGIFKSTDQERHVMRILNRQTTQRLIGEMFVNEAQQKREAGVMTQGMGLDAAFALTMSQDLGANMEALSKAWHNLNDAVAGPQAQNEIYFLTQLTSALHSMQTLALNHPEAIKYIAEGIASVAIALGAMSIGTLAVLGGLPVLIAGVVAGLAGLAALHWDLLKSGLFGAMNALSTFIKFITDLYHKIMSIFPGGKVPSAVGHEGIYSKGIGGGFAPMSFHPGIDLTPKPTPISLSLNVDGRTLAQAISEQLEQLYGFPTQAPSFDGSSLHAAGDDAYADIS